MDETYKPTDLDKSYFQKAMEMGFFKNPRNATLEEVADELGIPKEDTALTSLKTSLGNMLSYEIYEFISSGSEPIEVE